MLENFDFIVVGAGIAGASVAAELAKKHRVVVLEQEEVSGYHATGRSAAIYSEIYGGATIRALSRASRAFFTQERHERAPFCSPRGFLYIATAEQLEALERFAALPDVAPATERISVEQACAKVEVLRTGYLAGALLERDAFDLDVDAIHQFYLRALKDGGGELILGQPLTRLERANKGWSIALGTRLLTAPVLINAAGAWGDTVAAMAGVLPIGLQPLRRTALLVDAPTGLKIDEWPAVIDIGEQFYFKPDAGKLLLSPADETPTDPGDAYASEYDVAVAVDRVQAAADIPVSRVTRSWAGLRTFTPNRVPTIGYDDLVPDFFWLVGQGGYGIQTAPALARLAASLATGQLVPSDIIDQGLDISDLLKTKSGSTPNVGSPPLRGGEDITVSEDGTAAKGRRTVSESVGYPSQRAGSVA